MPITSDSLRKLAALAPDHPGQTGGTRPVGTTAQGAATPAPVPSASAPRFKESTLGPIKMDEYLDAHGIAYKIKQQGAQTLYVLDRGLCNPDHGDGQSAIIVSPTGPVVYQCFHASCKGKFLWKDARKAISGDKPIAQWCAGYDPNWKPPKVGGTEMMKGIDVATALPIEPGALVASPKEVDPMEFFEKRGKRPVFVPTILARYLASYLYPMVHTTGLLYRYIEGVWTGETETFLTQVICAVMKDRAQADMVTNTVKLLKGIINKEEKMWPEELNMINVANGMLDIQTMELLPHNPDYGSRTQLPVNYKPDAFSQRWHDFLKEIFPEDENYEKRGLLQQFFGYVLLRDCRYHKALFLYGTGANGKTTVLDVLQAMVGRDNTSSLSLADLTQRFKAQFLRGKLINLATETNTRDPLATELLKAVISGDPITAEQKYGEQFQFRPFAKFITAMNDAPVIPDKSYGLSRRLIVLNFERRFTDEEIKPRMAQYLIEEIDGVFNWAVEGLKILLTNDGFVIPYKVEEDTSEFMEALNPLLIFVTEMCEVHEGASVGTMELWECYAEWCAEGRNRPLGRNRFLDQVRMTFPKVERKTVRDGEGDNKHQQRILSGIGLTNQARCWLADRKARFSKRRED